MRLPHAVILAGGLSTRMGGGNKALRLLGGETLIARVISRLLPQCDRLAINANGEPEGFADFELPVIADGFAGFAGPLAGVLAGMDWANAEGADAVVSVSVDTPFVPQDLIHRLSEARGRSGLAVAASPDDSGRLRDHPTCALWPRALRDPLRAYLAAGHAKVMGFCEGAAVAAFPVQGLDPFLNLNTPEDLALAEAALP